jgi:hypothetical protein
MNSILGFCGRKKLTETLPLKICGIKTLEVLWLFDNPIAGNAPSELGGVSSLENFFIYQNELSGSLSTELGLLSQLKLLGHSYNKFTGWSCSL